MTINKTILKLAIPNIISNIAIPLNGIIDLAILGHFGSVHHIGALALGSLIFNFIYWNFAFLRMGASGMTAQAYGAQNNTEISLVLYRALLFGLIGGVLLIILQYPVFLLSQYAIEGSNEVLQLTAKYYFIRIYAAPATLGIYALTGWFIGMQNSVTPMFASILVNISNILLSLLFVFGFDMLIEGVALGTVIAQYIGFGFLFIYVSLKYKNVLEKSVLKFGIIIKGLGRFFSINADIFLRTLMVILVMSFFTSKSATQSDTILAVNSILLQYFLIFSFFIDGFAYASEAIVGKFTGAGDSSQLKKTVRIMFLWGFGLSLFVTLVFLLFDESIIRLLTNDLVVINESKNYIIWVQFIPLVAFSAFIWDGIYIGATKTKSMRNSLFVAGICFFSAYYVFFPLYGNHGIWLAFYLYLISRGLYQLAFSREIVK